MDKRPKTIGRYEIVRPLGRGGMGAVYLAEDPMLRRKVAIKVIRSGVGEEEQVLRRFRREAEISARLNHPSVITVFDVGEDPSFGPFLAMEYVDGGSLAQLIKEGKAPLGERLRILVEVMLGLEAAHAAGIVHRDIKPQNVMVSTDGRTKLMDFGIALGDDFTATRSSGILGTPAYIAPEVLTGEKSSEVSDRYAFAVMAFETVIGQLPFSADSMTRVLYQIVHELPTYGANVTPGVRSVFERALGKNPAGRYPDMKSFLAALVRSADVGEGRRLKLLATIDDKDPSAGFAHQPSAFNLPPNSVGLEPEAPSSWSPQTLVPAVAVVLAALGAAAWFLTRSPAPPGPIALAPTPTAAAGIALRPTRPPAIAPILVPPEARPTATRQPRPAPPTAAPTSVPRPRATAAPRPPTPKPQPTRVPTRRREVLRPTAAPRPTAVPPTVAPPTAAPPTFAPEPNPFPTAASQRSNRDREAENYFSDVPARRERQRRQPRERRANDPYAERDPFGEHRGPLPDIEDMIGGVEARGPRSVSCRSSCRHDQICAERARSEATRSLRDRDCEARCTNRKSVTQTRRECENRCNRTYPDDPGFCRCSCEPYR